MLYGCQFPSTSAVNFLDKKLRQWGRRLLQWPSGAPGAGVLGELGWIPFRREVLRSQFCLFGRLCSADSAGTHRGLAARALKICVIVVSMRRMCGECRPAAADAPWLPGDVTACARL